MPHSFTGIQAVLLDIEGTICSISFVKDTLFPYALSALPQVLQQRWSDSDFKQYRDAFPPEALTSPAAFEAHVKDLTARDVKAPYLKALQGYLWESGYESKAYATPLFRDVVPKLRAWYDQGLSLAIFSSGSVFAQKLLFGHVKKDSEASSNDSDDLKGLISHWYDTVNAGPKTEATSYKTITTGVGVKPEAVLFLSDNVKEVAAAKEAGMHAVVIDRPGNATLSDDDRKKHLVLSSLDEIAIENYR
ncbi:Enolase-phosphatase E1 [Sphaceloma murrayae]|uniref:Enolase-phosphatase E1 n=1 Tax=Sphaceloma murrayae TaxID=2082308 RepID=A0A2K1QY60_9PEZI|nr:Enolase-phosphatase E1 [Sphaceloma murrayae]